jgi:hypothetical protein
MRRAGATFLTALLALAGPPDAGARQKKDAPRDAPKALVALPLGVTVTAPAKLTVRGLKLDAATSVKALETNVTVKLLGKGKAAVPSQQEPARVGDTQADVEIAAPADFAADALALVFVTPDGETAPLKIMVDKVAPLAEKEPNNGFAQAQPLPIGQTVQGSIGAPQDVDVFRVEGKAGQKVTFEVFAARLGSALDSVLTLHDAAGHVLAVNDDTPDSLDSRLDVTLPRDGVYYIVLIDAHDQGGPAHVYRLQARAR